MRTKIEDLGKVSVTVEEEDYNKSKFYYENTIVVDSSLGMCCISIRPVPAGIPLTDTRFWKCITRLETSVMIHYRRLMDEMEELRQLFQSSNSYSGVAFSEKLGNDKYIGMSQRKLSDLFFELDKRISNLEGTVGHALFKLNVTPKCVVSDCPVEVTVACQSCGDCESVFDDIKIYFNDKLKFSNQNIVNINYTDFIEETTAVRVEATVCGKYYSETKFVIVNYPLIVSSGETVNDALSKTDLDILPYSCRFGGTYNITCEEDDYIFIITNKDVAKRISSIKINNEDLSYDTISYNKYNIYKSTNTYSAGDYTIIINN